MTEYGKAITITEQGIRKIQEVGCCFSINYDESTLFRNCCYMNLNLYGLNGFQSLGMICVHGSMKTEKAIQQSIFQFSCFHRHKSFTRQCSNNH